MAGRKPGFLASVYIPALYEKSIRFNSICILKIACGNKTSLDCSAVPVHGGLFFKENCFEQF